MPEATPTKRELYDALADRVRHLMQYAQAANEAGEEAARLLTELMQLESREAELRLVERQEVER
jgi:RNase P subunit RPR2